MKIILSSRLRCGGTLIVAVILSAVALLILNSYLALLLSRSTARNRSVVWNSAIPIAEAGIEEALTHLHDDSNTLTANGWSLALNGTATVYQKTRTNSDNSYWSVTLSNATTLNPVIYSTAFAPLALNGTYISRKLRVLFGIPSLFSQGIAASGTISINPRSSVVFDSFNSYPYSAAAHRANCGIATDSNAKPAISLNSNTDVYGPAETGPTGTISASGGTIGDTNWTSGIEPGWTNNTMNASFPTNSLPSPWAPVPPASAAWNGTNFTYVMGSGQYYSSSSVNIGVGSAVAITGNAVWYCSSSFQTSGSGYIYIAPGASLTLICGSTATISGNGIVNGPGRAADVSVVGLPTCTGITISGNAAFVGTIDAPQATLTENGNGDFYGAAIVQSYTETGSAPFHYDETLGGSGTPVLISWLEL